MGYQLIEYCCTIGRELVLIQLYSDIAVYMAPPPSDTEDGDECEISAAAYVRQSPGNALLPTDRNTPNHGAS